MPLVILVRHGRTKANADGILAGWTPGVHLDDQGESQVATVAERLAPLTLSVIVASPRGKGNARDDTSPGRP